MTTKDAYKRLQKEYRSLCKEPVSQIVSRPNPNDILDWHYVLEGSEGTPFAGGYYYGRVKFPPDYPFKPPGITMTTPNGRFLTQKNICLSMSNFHPETWNPMWSVSSILTGLLSFMMDYKVESTTGSVVTSDAEKKKLAKASLAYNCKISTFRKMFPEYVEKYEQMLSEQPARDSKESSASANLVERRKAPSSDGKKNATGEETNGQDLPVAARNQRKSFPAWGLVLLISVFGAVMALPLLL